MSYDINLALFYFSPNSYHIIIVVMAWEEVPSFFFILTIWRSCILGLQATVSCFTLINNNWHFNVICIMENTYSNKRVIILTLCSFLSAEAPCRLTPFSLCSALASSLSHSILLHNIRHTCEQRSIHIGTEITYKRTIPALCTWKKTFPGPLNTSLSSTRKNLVASFGPNLNSH